MGMSSLIFSSALTHLIFSSPNFASAAPRARGWSNVSTLYASSGSRALAGSRMSASAEDGAALQQFCLLAKSAKGAGCASLIGQALEHPGVFVFGELLDMPSVKEARPSSTTPRGTPSYRPMHTRRAPRVAARGHGRGAASRAAEAFRVGNVDRLQGRVPAPRAVPR